MRAPTTCSFSATEFGTQDMSCPLFPLHVAFVRVVTLPFVGVAWATKGLPEYLRMPLVTLVALPTALVVGFFGGSPPHVDAVDKDAPCWLILSRYLIVGGL